MTYIENVFICLAAPLIIAVLCVNRRRRASFLFILCGMAACLLSAYINTFFAAIYDADAVSISVEIAPVVEEIMKLLPLLFYLLVFEPERKDAQNAIIVIAASFATFENACYLTENGASQLSFLMIRGFGTGSMHIVCGAVVGYGLLYVWKYPWLKIAGTFGLLCVAITYHAVYNLLLSAGGALQTAAYLTPVATILLGILFWKKHREKPQKENAVSQ